MNLLIKKYLFKNKLKMKISMKFHLLNYIKKNGRHISGGCDNKTINPLLGTYAQAYLDSLNKNSTANKKEKYFNIFSTRFTTSNLNSRKLKTNSRYQRNIHLHLKKLPVISKKFTKVINQILLSNIV